MYYQIKIYRDFSDCEKLSAYNMYIRTMYNGASQLSDALYRTAESQLVKCNNSADFEINFENNFLR